MTTASSTPTPAQPGHTQWRVERREGMAKAHYGHCIVDAEKAKPNDAGTFSGDCVVAERVSDEHADLIAAAPDLLAACQATVAGCRCRGTGAYEGECRLCGDSTFDHACEYPVRTCNNKACSLARAAIAKAAAAKSA